MQAAGVCRDERISFNLFKDIRRYDQGINKLSREGTYLAETAL